MTARRFEVARQTGSHLLVQLKKNQPDLFERILAMAETEMPVDQILTKDLARNRRTETALHVSSTKLSAQQAAAAIRGHWGIENKNHYVRDTTFVEDQSRIQSNPGVFARLRSHALNILRSNGVQNVKDALRKNAITLDRTLGLKGL